MAILLMASLTLAGCVAHSEAMRPARQAIPRPSTALLAPEAPPKCLFDEAVAESAPVQAASAVQDDATAERAGRRERERDCFRDAERRIRAKLARLQAAVQRTMQALDAFDANIH
jgi:hypothetical protein